MTAGAIDVAYVLSQYGTTANNCGDVGEEFRPLQEKDKYGQNNPYQDPARGRLPAQKSDANGAIASSTTNNVLLNLSGDNSIIGRSIVIYNNAKDANGNRTSSTPMGCCIIGYDKNPNGTTYYPSYGHGNYGGYGHGYSSYPESTYGNQYAYKNSAAGARTADHGHKHGSDYATHSHNKGQSYAYPSAYPSYKTPSHGHSHGLSSKSSYGARTADHGHKHGSDYNTHSHDHDQKDFFGGGRLFPSAKFLAPSPRYTRRGPTRNYTHSSDYNGGDVAQITHSHKDGHGAGIGQHTHHTHGHKGYY